jgi:hypothetical protein
MRDESAPTPPNSALPGREPPAAADPGNGIPPPPPADRVATGPPSSSPAGDQIRAGDPSAKPGAAPQSATGEKGKEAPPEVKDGFREVVETIVFVVVLVLLLKAFLAEAFVIPTGSMAPTLLGYHRNVTCPQCGTTFPVNLSEQLDPERRGNWIITGCTCPNCFLPFNLPAPKQ